ncbi:MAG: HEAT repeat domain-containing protein [Candidatus Thorarchaeota archaeon]
MDYKEVRSEIKGGRVDDVLKGAGRAQGIQFLLEALKDKDKRIRVNSIHHLEKLEVIEAVGGLVPLLSDRDQDVQNAAVSALSKIGKHSIISIIWALETPGSQRENASKVLSNIGPKLISENLEEIRNTNIGSCFHLATFLELYHPDSEIKQTGIDVSSALLSAGMSNLSLKDTANKIFSSLEDAAPEVRERGAQMIGRMAVLPEISILKLTKLLDDPSEPVVIAAIKSLAMFGEPRVLPNLEKKSKSKSPEIRKAVAANLGKIYNPKAAELLIPLLIDEKNTSVIGTADFSLQRLGENAIPALIESFSKGNPLSADVAFKIGRASIPSLLAVLDSKDETSVKQAQDALIQFSERTIAPLSQEISRQPSPQFIRNSIPLLGQLPGDQPIIILWSLSKDKSNRKLIAANLKENAQAVECLVHNIEEFDESMIEGISAILMQLPAEMIVEPLILGFSTAPTKYHNFLINLLQRIGEKTILSRFKDMAKISPEEARALLLALCGIEEFQKICKKGRKTLKIR